MGKRSEQAPHQRRYISDKWAIWEAYILFDPNNLIFWKSPNYGDNKQICGCQRFGVEQGMMIRQSTYDF